MSSDVIIVPRDIGRRAEGWIVGGGAGNVIKGVELLLEENLFHETSLPAPGPAHVDCSAVFKRAMKILSDSPFDALGVDMNCGTTDVRKAYKKLALKYHPDKNPKTTPLFQLIQTAMSKLSAAEDRQKEIEAQQRKKTSFPPATGAHPTPSSFSAKNAPFNANNNNPRPTGAAPSAPSGPGSYFHSASYDSYSGKHNAYSNPPSRANNPFAQANAQRQQSYPSATPSASNAANNNNNEARRRNYYEELLKEQYRKAAESDQRAKEYAAKRAAEQKAEFDNFAKKAQQAYAQYQNNLHNFNAHNNTNSTNAGTNSQHPTPRGPADPPLNSFRAGYNNSSNPPSARGESGSAKTSYHPFANNNNANGANINTNNNAGNNAANANPNSARSSSSSARDSVPPVYPSMSTGRTYGVRSDGRVFPQAQSYVSPRPTADNTSGKNAPPTNNGSANASERERQSVPPLRPTMASNSSDSSSSSYKSYGSASNAANNNSAGNNKKVVPKPFSFRLNSVSSAVVELEWKTSLLHHCTLGVELSWKEHSAGIWEVSEKLIRSGCCRKKNLLPTHCYDFRVRAVEDLPHGLTGSKSEWSEVISVLIPAVSATPQNNSTNQSNSSHVHTNHTNHTNHNSNNMNSNSTSDGSSKQPAPTNSAGNGSNANANANANSSKSNEGESAKLQPSAPTSAKLSGAGVPQKFRRFNSKTHRQMDLDSQHGSYGDMPRDSKTKEKEKQDDTEKEKSVFSSPSSSSKIFSASAREAWGKETLSAKHGSDNKDKEKEKEKERSKEKDGESDFGEDVQFVEVDGELDEDGDTTEIEEEEELRRKDKDKQRKRDKERDEFYAEDEVTEDEEIGSAHAAKKKNAGAEDAKKKSSPGHTHTNTSKSHSNAREPGAGVRIHPEQGDNNRDGAESDSTLSSADRDRDRENTLPKVDKDSRTNAAKKQHIFPHKIDNKKKETPKKATTPAALNKQASLSRDSKEDKGGKEVPKKRSPFALTEDEESSDAYEGEGFAIEEEMHFQLVSPAASINSSTGAQTTSSSGRKKAGEKSRSNVMEVLGHPVHCEPFARSEVAGFLLADQTVVANATCGDWARVKVHVTKDAVSSSNNASASAATLNSKKRVSTNSSTPDVQAQKAAIDVWGWCLIKDKTQTFLKPVESKRAPSVMRARRNSSSSSISSRTDSRESNTHTPVKSRETGHATNVNEFKTPLTRKTLGSKNSLGNTSLFNLNKPTPVTNKKPVEVDLNNIGKLGSDVESIDLEDEDSFDEEQDVEEWTECHDDQGHIYYYNQKTNQSSWDAPEWIEEVDAASGAKYYCHFVYNGEEVSMTSTWTRPKRFARVYREVPDV